MSSIADQLKSRTEELIFYAAQNRELFIDEYSYIYARQNTLMLLNICIESFGVMKQLIHTFPKNFIKIHESFVLFEDKSNYHCLVYNWLQEKTKGNFNDALAIFGSLGDVRVNCLPFITSCIEINKNLETFDMADRSEYEKKYDHARSSLESNKKEFELSVETFDVLSKTLSKSMNTKDLELYNSVHKILLQILRYERSYRFLFNLSKFRSYKFNKKIEQYINLEDGKYSNSSYYFIKLSELYIYYANEIDQADNITRDSLLITIRLSLEAIGEILNPQNDSNIEKRHEKIKSIINSTKEFIDQLAQCLSTFESVFRETRSMEDIKQYLESNDGIKNFLAIQKFVPEITEYFNTWRYIEITNYDPTTDDLYKIFYSLEKTTSNIAFKLYFLMHSPSITSGEVVPFRRTNNFAEEVIYCKVI